MLPFAPNAQLPRMVRDLADRLGFSAVLLLVERLGGTTVPVPMRLSPQGEARFLSLCDTVGSELAEALCREYGGTDLYIPLCRQALLDQRNIALNRDRDVLAKDGIPEREIVTELARKYGVSDRNVWRILKKSPPEEIVPSTRPQQARLW